MDPTSTRHYILRNAGARDGEKEAGDLDSWHLSSFYLDDDRVTH
jgi:hypothetical protein